MILIYRLADGAAEQIVHSLAGVDLDGRGTAEAPEDLRGRSWDAVALAWIEDWSALDAALHARIDAEAGEVRKRFITSAPGQELTYQRKEAEARAWLAAGAPALVGTDFPFLAAEAAATGQDAGTAAAAIVAAADLWSAVGSAIEGARIAAKRAVAAATTADAKNAAASVDWAALTA